MDARMLLLVAAAVFSAPGAHSKRLTSKKYSIHTDSRTWNEARAICEAEGGQLAMFNRNETFDALIAYRSTEEDSWMVNVKNDTWIGLNSPAVRKKYRWANCKPLKSDQWTSPGRMESGYELCVVGDKDTCRWKPEHCRERRQYICEVKTGACTYTLTSGYCNNGAEARRTVEADDQTECQERCESEYTSGMPCWLFVYDSSGCVLYFANIPWQCEPSASNMSATFGIRSCFTFRFHESKTTIPDDDSNYPITSCDVNTSTASTTTQSGLDDTQSVQPAGATTYSSTLATTQAALNSNSLGKALGDDPDTTHTTTQPSSTTTPPPTTTTTTSTTTTTPPPTTTTTPPPTTTTTPPPTTTATPPLTTTTPSPPTTTTTPPPTTTTTPPPTRTTTPPPTTTTTSPPTTTTTPPPMTTTTSPPTTTTTSPPTTRTIPPPTTTTIPPPTTTTTLPPTTTKTLQPTTTTTTPLMTTKTSPPTTTTTTPLMTTKTSPPTTTTTTPLMTTKTSPPTTTTTTPPTSTTTRPPTTTTTSPPTTTTSHPAPTTTPPPTTTTPSHPITATTTLSTAPTTTLSNVAHGPSAASQIDVDNKTSDICPCEICVMVKNSTEIQDVIDELRVLLKVDQSTLSAVRRKRISQADDRPSATIIGYSGVVFITAVFSVLVISDTLTLCQQLAKKK